MGEETMAKQAAAVVQIKSKLTITMETVSGILKQYEEIMSPKRATSEEEGVEQQTKLLRHIKMVMRLEGQDFNTAWDSLLQWVYKNRDGCMHMRYRNRWQDKMKAVAVMDRNFLERVLHMMAQTCDPQSRSVAVSRYDWNRIHRCVNDEMQVERLKGFYHAP